MGDFELDFQNLNEALSRAERRREKFQEFRTLFFGVLIGAIVSTPLQLIFKPLSFNEGTVSYGSAEILTSLLPGQYFIIAMMFGFLVIAALIGAYRLYIRYDVDPSAHLRLPDDAESAFSEIKEQLQREADEIGLEVNESSDTIVFFDPSKTSGGLFGDTGNQILTLAHRDDLGLITIEFNQRDWRYKPLVSGLKAEYGSEN
ncbi:hypothetical protein OB920_00985 [Halobacteria archaeon HArc-gm2]|nr:hypothetical protein [Halobacteria archaeon HArc-gm2]